MSSAEKAAKIKRMYSTYVSKKVLSVIFSLIMLACVIILAASVGAADLSVKDVFIAIAAKFFPFVKSNPFNESIVWGLRLPRVMMGVLAGAGLAISGVAMQGITRNPLVSPFTVGISSAAAFGASLAIMFGIGFAGTGTFLIITNAFIFALICAFIVFGLAKLRGTSPETLVLAGIALMYFFSALTATLQFFASEEQLMAIVHWTFGTLTGTTWHEIFIVAVILLLCSPILIRFSWDLNAMFLVGDETARSLGINTARTRTILLILSSFITACIICFTGVIGFVGIVAPHVTRFLIGGDHRFLLPTSCIIGSILLVVADTVGRMIISPIIIPIGIVISFLGVPLFLYLMMTRKEEYWR
jgi:iron complex transport system permease protein